MVSTRLRALKTVAAPAARSGLEPAGAPPPPPVTAGTGEGTDGGTHEYERCRDERIRENMERMQKLGILDLAHQLHSSVAAGGSSASKRPYNRRATPSPVPPTRDLPPRRSSRLQSVTPVSYSELPMRRKDENTPRDSRILLEEGSKEEVYTDEHEKLLGTCETSWDLFVDGYNKDGVRIYDPVKGKTCHQCRQKTLGHRTHCSKCKIVQGQFCGDCLYMRYGENVLEANKNPDWTCPVCRGICNCSICRTKKGWAPTGSLYKKVSGIGFKSVAHYLIQTRRGQTNIEDVASANTTSAKRSLTFTDEEGPSENNDFKSNNVDPCDGQRLLLNSDCNEDKDADCSRDVDGLSLVGSTSIFTLASSEVPRKKLKETVFTLITKSTSDSIAGRLGNHGEVTNNGSHDNDVEHCNGKTILLDSNNTFLLSREREEERTNGGEEEMWNLETSIKTEKTLC